MATKQTALRLYVPGLFEDPEFQNWLNKRVGKGLATWHTGGEPDEMSDIFVTYDGGDGDECSHINTGMPKHCWDQLCGIAEANQVSYAILHLINAAGDPSDIPGADENSPTR